MLPPCREDAGRSITAQTGPSGLSQPEHLLSRFSLGFATALMDPTELPHRICQVNSSAGRKVAGTTRQTLFPFHPSAPLYSSRGSQEASPWEAGGQFVLA